MPHIRMRMVLLWLLGAAALILSLSAYFVPTSFPRMTNRQEPLHVSYHSPSMAKTALPSQTVLELIPGSSEEKAVERILSHYQIHRCIHTLTGISEDSPVFSIRLKSSGTELSLSGCCHVRVNETVYRVGWLGDYQGQKLSDELCWALGLNKINLAA